MHKTYMLRIINLSVLFSNKTLVIYIQKITIDACIHIFSLFTQIRSRLNC